MSLIFMDGFDKYGGANSISGSTAALMAGEWNSISNAAIVAPLSATGYALQQISANAMSVAKTITPVGRLIGGVRFSTTLTNASGAGIQFTDSGGAQQCGISIATTGVISLRNGNYASGTIIGSSGTSISANTTHYLEWDITLGNAAAYNIYLDGVPIINGTGDTTATVNNNIGGITLGAASTGAASITFDDLYLFDTTGTRNNAVLLTSPRIETTVPISDSTVQFAFGAAVLGNTVPSATVRNPAAGMFLRRFVPSRSCTLNSISIMSNATSGTAQWRPVVYADSSGVPGTLMSAGSTVTGITVNTALTMPLTTPQSLTAGTPYWLGFMSDTTIFMQMADNATNCVTSSSAFVSGAPPTAPAMFATNTLLIWGNITGTGINYYEVNQQPPAGVFSNVTDTTVGHEDLYGFPALSTTPANVHAVVVKGYCSKSDSGARTVSLRMNSGGTDSGGSLTGQTPGTTYGWLGTNFETDPNTGLAWSGAGLNAATSGFRIDA